MAERRRGAAAAEKPYLGVLLEHGLDQAPQRARVARGDGRVPAPQDLHHLRPHAECQHEPQCCLGGCRQLISRDGQFAAPSRRAWRHPATRSAMSRPPSPRPPHQRGQALPVEGALERAQLVQDAPQRPHVALAVVRPVLTYLRAQVVGRPNLRGPPDQARAQRGWLCWRVPQAWTAWRLHVYGACGPAGLSKRGWSVRWRGLRSRYLCPKLGWGSAQRTTVFASSVSLLSTRAMPKSPSLRMLPARGAAQERTWRTPTVVTRGAVQASQVHLRQAKSSARRAESAHTRCSTQRRRLFAGRRGKLASAGRARRAAARTGGGSRTRRDEDVLRLEVAVQHVLAVHVEERQHNLHKPAGEGGGRARQRSTCCDKRVRKRPARAALPPQHLCGTTTAPIGSCHLAPGRCCCCSCCCCCCCCWQGVADRHCSLVRSVRASSRPAYAAPVLAGVGWASPFARAAAAASPEHDVVLGEWLLVLGARRDDAAQVALRGVLHDDVEALPLRSRHARASHSGCVAGAGGCGRDCAWARSQRPRTSRMHSW